MREDWIECKVSEIADLYRGITYNKTQVSNSKIADYKPILRGNNIDDNCDGTARDADRERGRRDSCQPAEADRRTGQLCRQLGHAGRTSATCPGPVRRGPEKPDPVSDAVGADTADG